MFEVLWDWVHSVEQLRKQDVQGSHNLDSLRTKIDGGNLAALNPESVTALSQPSARQPDPLLLLLPPFLQPGAGAALGFLFLAARCPRVHAVKLHLYVAGI